MPLIAIDSCAACRFARPLDDQEVENLPWGSEPNDFRSCRYVEAGPTVIVYRPIVRSNYVCELGEAGR